MKYKLSNIRPFGRLIEPIKSGTRIDEVDIDYLRNCVRREHLIVLRGFSVFQHTEFFVDYCERWGEISLWPFGKVLELVQQDNPDDHIFDHSYVPLHWDGMYRPHVPEFQVFRCVIAPLAGMGGRTTFSNTTIALNQVSDSEKTAWRHVSGIYRRKMEFYDSKVISPIVDNHPYAGYPVIRYAEPHTEDRGRFINPPNLTFTGLVSDQLEQFHSAIKRLLYSDTNYYAHEWQAGDVVIANNFSLLHGREAFVSSSPRHLQRVHIESDPPFINRGLEQYQ